MSFPNRSEKHGHDSILTAKDIVSYRTRLGRTPDLRSPGGALFCLERGLPRRMRRRVPVRKTGSMNADVHETRRTKKPVAILTNFGGGAPIVGELAEELVVMGLAQIILMTWGGALQPDLEPGDIVVCNRAIRDDGTSHHYLPPEKYVDADIGLVAKLESAIRSLGADPMIGTTWTTDAPYRETREEVEQYQSEGIKVVEMESSGLFTIGQVKGVQTASVVVVMDSLATFEWKAPKNLDGIISSLELVYQAAIDVLGGS